MRNSSRILQFKVACIGALLAVAVNPSFARAEEASAAGITTGDGDVPAALVADDAPQEGALAAEQAAEPAGKNVVTGEAPLDGSPAEEADQDATLPDSSGTADELQTELTPEEPPAQEDIEVADQSDANTAPELAEDSVTTAPDSSNDPAVPWDDAVQEAAVELTPQAPTVKTTAEEKDTSSYDASKLFEDGSVYAISRTSDTSTLVSSGSAKLAKAAVTLDDYWRISNLGGGRYQLFGMKSGKALSYAADGSSVSMGKDGVWLLLSRLDGTYSLVPENLATMRLQASGSAAGSGLALSTASKSAAQGFYFTLATWLTTASTTGAKVSGGIYEMNSAVGGNQVVQVAGASKAAGANVATYTANDEATQRWQFVSVGNNLYTIKAVHSGMALDVAGGSTASKANVNQATPNGSLSQLWYLVKNGSDYLIRNAKSGLGLSVAGGKAANNTNVRLYKSKTSASQRFSLVRDVALEQSIKAGKPFATGIYTIASGNDASYVLSVAGSSTAAGANVQLSASNGALNQKVELTYLGYGLYTVQFANSGKYLHASGTDPKSGDNVVQETHASHSRNQQWYFMKNGSLWQLCSALSGLSLNVKGGKAQEGANVNVHTTRTTISGERFSLKKTPLLANGVYVFSSTLAPAELIEVRGQSKKANANVQISRMTKKATGQRWKIYYLKNGTYKIINRKSRLSLDVKKGSKKSGATIIQRKYGGKNRQQWLLGIDDTGAITIRNARSGKYVDLADGKSASGTDVRQWDRIEGKRQGFVAYKSSSDFVKKGKTGYQNPSKYYQISAYRCVLPSYANGFYTYVSAPVLSPTATRTQCVEAFIKRAYDYLGTSYVWDWAMAPGQGVDCAGLVMQCLYACGIQTPYNTYDHMFDPWQDHNAENMRADKKFKQVSFESRKRGDLIFYKGHVGIYLGNDQIINAYEPQVKVQSVYSWTVTGCSRVFV